MFDAGCKDCDYRLPLLLPQAAAAGKKILVVSKD
jgi:hypothetical protein